MNAAFLAHIGAGVRIRVFGSEPDPGLWVVTGSGSWGRNRIRVCGSEPDPGVWGGTGGGVARPPGADAAGDGLRAAVGGAGQLHWELCEEGGEAGRRGPQAVWPEGRDHHVVGQCGGRLGRL